MGKSVKSDDSYAKIEQVQDIARQIAVEEVGKVAEDVKEDFLIIFGVFASILIFLGVEVQVFQQAKSFAHLIGTSLFLLGSLLLFFVTLHNIIRGKVGRKDWLVAVGVIVLVTLVPSALCFMWATGIIKS